MEVPFCTLHSLPSSHSEVPFLPRQTPPPTDEKNKAQQSGGVSFLSVLRQLSPILPLSECNAGCESEISNVTVL